MLGRHAGAPVTQEHGARGAEDLEPWEEELRRRCTPAVIDYVKCLGRTYAGGRGGQCGKTVKKDGLCGRCGGGSGPAHGLVTGRVPKAKWKAFGISEADVQRLREGEGAAGLKTAGGSRAPARVRPASEALGSNAGVVPEVSQLVAPGAVRPASVAASQGSGGVAGLGVAPAPASASAPRQALLKRRRVAGANSGPDDVVAQDHLHGDVAAASASIGDGCAREGSHMLGSSVDVAHSRSPPARRQGVVSGFGAERTDDALGDQAQRDRDAMSRARARRDDGTRGRVRDFQGNDLDRSAGGAWSFGRR